MTNIDEVWPGELQEIGDYFDWLPLEINGVDPEGTTVPRCVSPVPRNMGDRKDGVPEKDLLLDVNVGGAGLQSESENEMKEFRWNRQV